MGQSGTTLGDLFAKQTGMSASIVFEPERRTNAAQPTFANFGLTARELPALRAYVPERVDDLLQVPPDDANFYDGLPQRLKLLYLLSTLSGTQLQTAVNPGLGRQDLSRDQQKVFDSVFLSETWNWTKTSVGSKGEWLGEAKGTFSKEEMSKFRVRFFKNIQYVFSLSDGTGMTSTDSYMLPKREPREVWSRGFGDSTDKKTCFGVTFKSVSPNLLKKGDLDFEIISDRISVDLTGCSTVKGAIEAVGRASNLTLTVDPRVGKRSLRFRGGAVPVRSALSALCLGFASTFRKVGDGYHLTRDVQGIGSHRLRASLWSMNAEYIAEQNATKWRSAIKNAGILQRIPFDDKSPVKAGDSLEGLLASHKQGYVDVPPGLINDEVRSLMQRFNETYTSQPVSSEKLSLGFTYGYEFVMPNGKPLSSMSAGYLGFPSEFEPKPVTHSTLPFAKVSIPDAISLGLTVKTNEDVASAVGLVNRFGAKRVAIEVFDKPVAEKCVAAMQKIGVKVDLQLRPYSLGWNPRAEQDLNLLLQNGNQARVVEKREWVQGLLKARSTDIGIVPSSAQCADSMDRVVHVSGFERVLILNPEKPGYKGAPLGYSMIEALAQLNQLGYSLANRIAFLRETGFDPVDIAPENARFLVDLRTRFYTDDKLRGESSVFDGTPEIVNMDEVRSKWRTFLLKKRAEAAEILIKLLAGKQVEGVRLGEANPGATSAGLFPLDLSKPYPSVTVPAGQPDLAQPSMFALGIEPGDDLSNAKSILRYASTSKSPVQIVLLLSDLGWIEANGLLEQLLIPVRG